MRTMRILSLASSLALTVAASGCGIWIDSDDDDDRRGSTETFRTPPPSNPTPTSQPKPVGEPLPAGPVNFEGYVQSAFEVNVDGTPYPDIEAFYTAESARLGERVLAAGYDASWEARFDAQVGLADLWREMTVYLAPLNDTGYQAQTTVRENGRFATTLPANAVEHEYRVRANKRIAIVLTREDETIKICYNFSAIEQRVPFARDGLPIILDNFNTQVTSYACEVAEGGVTVPTAPAPKKLAAGRTKSEVASLLGVDGLYVSAPTEWCWAYRPGPKGVCAEDKEETGCDCKVVFDDFGLVASFENVATWALAPSAVTP